MIAHDHVGKEKVLPKEVEIASPVDGGSDGPCVQTVQVKKDKDTALVRHREIHCVAWLPLAPPLLALALWLIII